MKLKDLIVPFSVALLVTAMIQYFFAPQQEGEAIAKSGQRFAAPQTPQVELHKPLQTEIDFLDTSISKKPIITKVETDRVKYEFSTDGAILSRLEFKRYWAGQEGYLSTIFPPVAIDKERGSFLVALDEKTPYYFELKNKQEVGDLVEITYQTDTPVATIFKKFIVFKNSYRFDVELTITPRAGQKIQPRVFFASPLVPELIGEDVITGIANNEKNSVKILQKTEQNVNSYWSNPTLFGTQNRYFVHSMVADPDHFAKRGYYKVVDLDSLYSIVEGPVIGEPKKWTLSFYMGPKEDEAMAVVDKRLEATLNYGWFSFISKPVSQFLLDLLNFLKKHLGNYGYAIIVLTLLFKLILLPFTYRAEAAMKLNVKKQQEFQRKLEYLQSKYKNDPEALARARADLMRSNGLPGLGGCLPLLLQIPLFAGLSIVLANAIELYKAPFAWIPDLSSPDRYYILPFLIVVAIIWHAPATDAKQRISSIFMGCIVGAIMANVAAGLAVYVLTSTLLAVFQSFITKQLKI